MQIIEMRVHPIAIADPPLRSSYGLHAPYALRTILELTSEAGMTGISETHRGDAIAQGFNTFLAQVVGSDAFRLAGKLLPMIGGKPEGTNLERSQTFHEPGENPFDASRRLHSAIEIGKIPGAARMRSARRQGPRCGFLPRLPFLQTRGRRR